MTKCIVCGVTPKQNGTLSFHRFPSEKTLREKWLKACHKEDADIKLSTRVCSKHFVLDEDYEEYVWPANKLRSTAVPSPSNSYFATVPAAVNAREPKQVSFVYLDRVRIKTEAVNLTGATALSIKPSITPCARTSPIQNCQDTAASQSGSSPNLMVLHPIKVEYSSPCSQIQDESLKEAVISTGATALSIKPSITPCARTSPIQNCQDTAASQSGSSPNLMVLHPIKVEYSSPCSQIQDENLKEAVISTATTDSKMDGPTRTVTELLRTPRYPGDLKVEHFATPDMAKQNLELISRALQKEKKKVKALRVEKKRLKDKISALQGLLENLHENRLISTEAATACMKIYRSSEL